VPLLCQLYLLSPLLVPLARTRWSLLLIATGVIQLAVQLLYYPALLGPALLEVEPGWLAPMVDGIPKWFFATRIFWFSLGIVTGFHVRTVREWAICHRRLLFAAAVLLIPVGMIEWESILRISNQPLLGHRETLVDTLYAAAVILSFVALDDVVLPWAAQLRYLGTHSFGIYLVHSPVMEVLARGLYHVAPWLLGQPFLLQPMLWAAGLGVPLALMALVRRSPAQRYYRHLFG
jgi:peptidoglycan/LPS O-acetylase OafA/YrhL